MIISLDAEKSFDKTQYLFMIKILSKLGIEGNFLKMIKGIYEIPTANIMLSGEILKAFSLISETRWCLLLPPLFNIVLEVLVVVVQHEKERKDTPITKEEVKLCLFVVDMIFYIKLLTKLQNILMLISKLNTVAGNNNLQKICIAIH